jgi:hypothetical protein
VIKQQHVLRGLIVLITTSGCSSRFEAQGQEAGSVGTSSAETSTHDDTLASDSTTNGHTRCASAGGFPSYGLGTSVQVHAGGDLNFSTAVAVGDFDGDGAMDVAVAWYEVDVSHVAFLRGNGAGALEPPVHVVLAVGPVNAILATGRIDGDNRDDLAVASYGAAVATLLGTPNGLSVWAERGLEDLQDPAAIQLTDVGANGLTDLVYAGHSWELHGIVGILAVDGTGDLGDLIVAEVFDHPTDIAAAKLDGDDLPEIIVALNHEDESGTLLVYRGSASGFGAQTNWDLPHGAGALAVLDVDDDGRPDIVVVNGEGVQIFNTRPDGDLVLGDFIAESGGSPVVADFNHDGYDDLAMRTADGIAILAGNGCGLEPAASVPFAGLADFAAADMNGSGTPDLVIMTSQQSVQVFLAAP